MTIYVRKEEEKAYNALMLDNLTLEELKESVSVVLEICGLMRIYLMLEKQTPLIVRQVF